MHGDRDEVIRNLEEIRVRIAAAAARAARDPDDVLLVAAAKTVPVEPIRWAIEAGVGAVGENYVNELREKRARLPEVPWHFIGTLQSSTAHRVADEADVVETVAGERAARRLASRAARAARSIDVLIEVDLTGERTGVAPDDLLPFADLVASLEGVRLTGLMTLPPMPEDPEDSRPHFVRLQELRRRVQERHPEVLESSMGMSLDYEVAIEEGATMVRIGTALFGPRATEPQGPGSTRPRNDRPEGSREEPG
jgi:PLP dependent protein